MRRSQRAKVGQKRPATRHQRTTEIGWRTQASSSVELTRWKLRRAMAGVHHRRAALGLDKNPDKTFVGRIEKGFDFLGYAFSRNSLGSAKQTAQRHVTRCLRLYEQQVKKRATPNEMALIVDAYAATLVAMVLRRTRPRGNSHHPLAEVEGNENG